MRRSRAVGTLLIIRGIARKPEMEMSVVSYSRRRRANALAIAGLLYITTTEFVGAAAMQNPIGGFLPWPGVLLSAVIMLTGLATLVHLAAWPREEPSSPTTADAPSLILIAIICCVCLLTSLWAFSRVEFGTYLP